MTAQSSSVTGQPQPSPRQRWDERYAQLASEAKVEPSDFVAFCLPHLPANGRALDVAAGAGRHTIALAQRGLQVDAIDVSRQGLQIARRRARALGLIPGQQVRFIVADVERPWLPRRRYDVILVSLFLYRPLFAWLKAQLLPGGWLVYETFLTKPDGQPNSGTVRPDFQLRPGELKAEFSDLEILFYEEGDHHDRTTAQLLARKPITNYQLTHEH